MLVAADSRFELTGWLAPPNQPQIAKVVSTSKRAMQLSIHVYFSLTTHPVFNSRLPYFGIFGIRKKMGVWTSFWRENFGRVRSVMIVRKASILRGGKQTTNVFCINQLDGKFWKMALSHMECFCRTSTARLFFYTCLLSV